MSELVLLVDADKPERLRQELAFQKAGFKTSGTGDVEIARATLASEPVAATVIGFETHGLNGWVFAVEQLMFSPELVVFVTAEKVDLKLSRRVLERGIREVLYQPIDSQLLVKKVQHALRMRQTPKTTAAT